MSLFYFVEAIFLNIAMFSINLFNKIKRYITK